MGKTTRYKYEAINYMSKITNFDIIDQISSMDYDCVLTAEAKILMSKSLHAFMIDSINKFIKGQKEHGGDIRERDLDSEMRQEHIDLFWYQSAKSWPKYNVIKRLKTKMKDRV